ncbi:GntR family transcriptional regulator [Marinobacterium arenosum]|uniref:GntR family transcriptional regulator n=1 Tax=Marinobacterium arenosum TaxID=2862496 RepID=UPI001C974F93|nr:GntR family transcriptional regulator [Marinobacterium arenosum]MBY4677362.1 GntR family transcriptional regulator [Marinobacterium arenosum]
MENQGTTPAEQAARQLSYQLRQLIMTGEYGTGSWLKQIEIERRFGVNRFTVRSAFNELTVAGLLEHVPYRGHRVKAHTLQERIELSEARALIESVAAVQALQHIDEAGLQQLTELAEQFRQALEAGDRPTMVAHNFAFHRLFYSYCRNRYISRLVEDMRERGVTGAANGWRTDQLQRLSCQDHFEMVEALRARDGARLQTLIHLHLNRWREGLPAEAEPAQ